MTMLLTFDNRPVRHDTYYLRDGDVIALVSSCRYIRRVNAD